MRGIYDPGVCFGIGGVKIPLFDLTIELFLDNCKTATIDEWSA
jgi:hypothetical protein